MAIAAMDTEETMNGDVDTVPGATLPHVQPASGTALGVHLGDKAVRAFLARLMEDDDD